MNEKSVRKYRRNSPEARTFFSTQWRETYLENLLNQHIALLIEGFQIKILWLKKFKAMIYTVSLDSHGVRVRSY